MGKTTKINVPKAIGIAAGIITIFAFITGITRLSEFYFTVDRNRDLTPLSQDDVAFTKYNREDVSMSRAAYRTKLLATLYGLADCDKTQLTPGQDCPPAAAKRLREEAVRELAKIDGRDLDLEGADLSGLDLNGANLRGVNLEGANLTGTSMISADLRNARINNATLQEANLSFAQLDHTDLTSADLYNARFYSTDLTHSPVPPGATAIPGDPNAEGQITQEQARVICGDSGTKLPRDFDRPQHFFRLSVFAWSSPRPEWGCPPS